MALEFKWPIIIVFNELGHEIAFLHGIYWRSHFSLSCRSGILAAIKHRLEWRQRLLLLDALTWGCNYFVWYHARTEIGGDLESSRLYMVICAKPWPLQTGAFVWLRCNVKNLFVRGWTPHPLCHLWAASQARFAFIPAACSWLSS